MYGFKIIRQPDGFRPLVGVSFRTESAAKKACLEGVAGLVIRGVLPGRPHEIHLTKGGKSTQRLSARGKWEEIREE